METVKKRIKTHSTGEINSSTRAVHAHACSHYMRQGGSVLCLFYAFELQNAESFSKAKKISHFPNCLFYKCFLPSVEMHFVLVVYLGLHNIE